LDNEENSSRKQHTSKMGIHIKARGLAEDIVISSSYRHIQMKTIKTNTFVTRNGPNKN